MPHPRSYVWPSVVIGWLVALTIAVSATFVTLNKRVIGVDACWVLTQERIDRIESRVRFLESRPARACTCDHAALLDLHKECKASIEELRGHIEAVEDRLSKGESRILSEWLKAQDVIKAIQRRLDKLEGRSPKPPVRRQASCGAHPPSCEGIAALGADGEPDGVTGVLCQSEPWYPGKHLHDFIDRERDACEQRRIRIWGRLRRLYGFGWVMPV